MPEETVAAAPEPVAEPQTTETPEAPELEPFEPITKFDRERLRRDPTWRPKRAAPAGVETKSEEESPAEKDEDVAGEPPAKEDKKVAGTSAEQKQVDSAIQKFKAKVDGQEVELTVDELIKGYQLGASSTKKYQEAAKVKKDLTKFITAMKENPMDVLAHPALGHNVRELVEDWLYKQIQIENMDPRERENWELKHKLEISEKEKQERIAAEEEKKSREVRSQLAVEYQNELKAAVEGSGLPKTPETVRRIVHYLREGLKRGHRLKAVDVIDLVKRDYTNTMKNMFGSASAEQLISLFGDDFAEKIRKHKLSTLKNVGETPEEQPVSSKGGKRKPMNKEQWREMIRRRVES